MKLRWVAAAATLVLYACAGTVRVEQNTATPKYTAVVDGSSRNKDGAVVDGLLQYHTIGAALSAIVPRSHPVIYIRKGRYHEKLTVASPSVAFIGESRDSTVITFDAASDTPSPTGGTYGTRGSWTLRIAAPDFRAENLTIENAFDYNANSTKSDSDRTKFKNPQGVALMTDIGSDRASFVNVRFLGHQDTLFANVGRHFFYHCEIDGNVDFIFGAGRAVFEDCDIISLDRGSKSNNGYVTAASTSDTTRFGFFILHSRLKKESPVMASGSVTLGRPWHPFADPHSHPSVAYIENRMDDHIGPKGWDRMSSVDSTGTRIWYEPESARFAELRSRGPGAAISPTRPQLSLTEAAMWTEGNVLAGWDPDRTAAGLSADDSVAAGSDGEHADGRTLEEMIVGRYPGLEVIKLPNGGITFRIRGANSIYGSSEPLILLDGVELQAGGLGLQFLSPGDIEKIEVLKDVGATGIYGSKGANGVILITRKKGPTP